MSNLEAAGLPARNPPILLLIDTAARWTGGDVQSLTLYVDGHVAALSITLPTPKTVDALPDPNTFDSWIALIQGDGATRCDLSEHQRVLLLDIALTYRAFGRRLRHVKTRLFESFADTLVETARTLDDHESAEDVLREVMQWVHTVLPDNIFIAPENIPPLVQPSDDLFEPLASLVQLFDALHVSRLPSGVTSPRAARVSATAHTAPVETQDSRAETSESRETTGAVSPPTSDAGRIPGASEPAPLSTNVSGLAPPSTDVSELAPPSTDVSELAPPPANISEVALPSTNITTSTTVTARDHGDPDYPSEDPNLDVTPDVLAQLFIISALWGAYSRKDLSRADFLAQVRDALTVANVTVEPFLTRLSESLPVDVDDASLGRARDADSIPGDPTPSPTHGAERGGSYRTVRVISSDGVRTFSAPVTVGLSTPTGTLPSANTTANLDTSGATTREGGAEDGGYESEDSMPGLETPNDSSDDGDVRAPAWTEEEFVHAVRNILLRRAI